MRCSKPDAPMWRTVPLAGPTVGCMPSETERSRGPLSGGPLRATLPCAVVFVSLPTEVNFTVWPDPCQVPVSLGTSDHVNGLGRGAPKGPCLSCVRSVPLQYRAPVRPCPAVRFTLWSYQLGPTLQAPCLPVNPPRTLTATPALRPCRAAQHREHYSPPPPLSTPHLTC